ncbi:hypothetical protein ACFLTH_01130 [Bacteroidota bacterium]
MKRFESIIFNTLILIILFGSTSFAQCYNRSSGIGFRMGFWQIGENDNLTAVSNFGNSESVTIGGIGFWLNYFSQVNQDLFFELSIGAAARVEENEFSDYSDHSKVSFVLPIIFSIKRIISFPADMHMIEPYLTVGAGPYLTGHVRENDTFDSEEVVIKSNIGICGGGGINFLMSNWLAVTFDIKYHLINLDPSNDFSDIDLGMGLNFRW